jgi:DNA invertase Pin-like site-specific DNA recombinase
VFLEKKEGRYITATGKFVSYLRVSTKKQGKSGLGLEAQREAIKNYLDGGRWSLLKEYVEIESGKDDDRPKLKEAISECQRRRATLIVAKLDRLSRSVSFTSSLMESGVEFVCCDFPHANRLTVHILSAVAEYERELIAKRVKESLAAAKRKGIRLGNPTNLTAAAREKGSPAGVRVRRMKARENALRFKPMIDSLIAKGMSLNAIAGKLTEEGELTPRGKTTWSAMTVKNILKYAGV